MNNTSCLICSVASTGMVDILDTHLEVVYEKLTDLKVHNETHYLCFICSRRLEQCYQLQQLVITQNHSRFYKNSYKTRNEHESYNSVIELSISKLLKVTIPSMFENLTEDKSQNVKQEVVEEDEFENLHDQDIKVEKECLESVSLVSKDIKFSAMREDPLNTNKYMCDICPYEANTDSTDRCDVFSNTFSQDIDLIRHKITHTGEKPYVCNVCKKTFSRSSDLIRHKRTHTGEKPYSCDVCNKSFCSSSYLIIHKRKHTGDKPFVCDVCNKTFSDGRSLISHKRKHTGDKLYVCNICNKTFADRSNLISHKRTHTGDRPYGCDVCNKTFSQSCNLIRHKRTHTGVRPFGCDICNKTFSQSSNLITHKRTHTGDKPYVCDVCNKRFSDGSYLIKHKRTHDLH